MKDKAHAVQILAPTLCKRSTGTAFLQRVAVEIKQIRHLVFVNCLTAADAGINAYFAA